MRLTDISLRKLKSRTEQYAVFDDHLPNFGVRVGTTGKLSFIVMYRVDGKRKRDTLGTYPIISLAEARSLARQRLAELVLGDAGSVGSEIGKSVTFADAVTDFLKLHCAVRNKPRTSAETERLLKRHWLPRLEEKKVVEVSPQDISAVLDVLMETPSEALHALAAIRKFFNWACQRHLIERSPCERIEINVRPQARTRALSLEELVIAYRAAEAHGYPYGTIVQLLALTGQRRGEIASLRWSYINEKERLITLPASLVKNNRQHVFVYGELVDGILKKLPRLGDMLFPARGCDDRPFSGWGKAKRGFDLAAGLDFTLHDLRRTWATRAADLGVHPWVIEAHLNHVSGVVSGVSAIYNRYSYVKEARGAVQIFDQRLFEALHVEEREAR